MGLFAAGPFQDMKNPVMKRTNPCEAAVEGSSGMPKRRTAARGMAEAELIWARMIRPVFGKLLESLSPSQPPNNPPRELATIKTPMSTAVVLCENPINSNHIAANDKADQGNEPVTP